jgi:hypothetical protein
MLSLAPSLLFGPPALFLLDTEFGTGLRSSAYLGGLDVIIFLEEPFRKTFESSVEFLSDTGVGTLFDPGYDLL